MFAWLWTSKKKYNVEDTGFPPSFLSRWTISGLLISDFDLIFVVHVTIRHVPLGDDHHHLWTCGFHPALSLWVADAIVACKHVCRIPESLALHSHPQPHPFRRPHHHIRRFNGKPSAVHLHRTPFVLFPFGPVRAFTAAAVLPQQWIHVWDSGRVHLWSLVGQPACWPCLLAIPGVPMLLRVAVNQAENFAH